VDLLPFVKGEKAKQAPHDKIFWRYSDGQGFAVRKGDYKLVKEAVRGKMFLFNIEQDPCEHNDLSGIMPEKVKELLKDYEEWNKDNVENHWPDDHIPHILKQKEEREKAMQRVSGGETK